jgi:DNA-directed RNA polymerase subunit M/transcription elongation factor TFIIS
VVVKDLSRLGRNFQKAEEFMQRHFPKLGVRFISVLDGFDSAKILTSSERLAMPIANLLNEYHVVETSHKIRGALESSRKNGKNICNKAPYGYIIRNRQFIIDAPAAEIVRRIFNAKISGMSNKGIADLLNKDGVLSPLEYKLQSQKSVPGQHFKKRCDGLAAWQSQSIRRILADPIYVGTLVQGKTMSLSHRDKRRFAKAPDEWAVCEKSHAPIVSETVFQIVADLLSKDNYGSRNCESYLFSGFAFCENCGHVLYHRKAQNNIYWQCMNKNCGDKRNINERNLVDAVLETLKMHMKSVIDFSEPIAAIEKEQEAVSNARINELNKQICAVAKKQSKLELQLSGGIIEPCDYEEMTAFYKIKSAQFQAEKDNVFKKQSKLIECIDEITARFKMYCEIPVLTREIVVTFIEKIVVESKNSVNIFFRYADLFRVCGSDEKVIKNDKVSGGGNNGT